MRPLCLAILLTFSLNSLSVASDSRSAEELLRSKLDAAVAVLKKDDVNESVKKKEITDIVSPIFDFALMAKLSLGKKHWPGLSSEEKKSYQEAFVRFIKTSYLDKMLLYTDEKIEYQPAVQQKNKVHVPTALMTKDKKISMIYKFYNSKNGWKIYDVEVQGVSLIVTYRSQFDSILQGGSFNDLLKKLENREISNPKSLPDQKQS